MDPGVEGGNQVTEAPLAMMYFQALRLMLGCCLLPFSFVTGFTLAKVLSIRRLCRVLKAAYTVCVIAFQVFLFKVSEPHFLLGVLFAFLGYRCLVPGLTGGLGTGKSSVSGFLKSHGWRVVDADEISRGILKRGSPAFRQVVKAFGDCVVDKASGEIDRTRLRHLIFQDPAKRRLLNRLTHPWIIGTILWRIFRFRICLWAQRVVIDVPLLFETKLNLLCGPVVVVFTAEDLQLRRLLLRDQTSSEELLRSMIKSQLPLKDKVSLADIVLDNNSTLDHLFRQVKQHFPC